MPDELHPRHLAIRVAEVAVFIAAVVIAITALPGLDEVKDRLQNASAGWVVAVALAEVGSCFGYLLVFRAVFCSRMSWGLSYDIAMSEQAANSLLPSGGAGGLALGVWALRQAGMPTSHIARRTVAFFVITSAANFFALIVVGIGVFLHIISGRGSAALTLVPALITALGVLVAALSPKLMRALGQRGADADRTTVGGKASRTLRSALEAGADGVDAAIDLLRSHSLGRHLRLVFLHGVRYRGTRVRVRGGRPRPVVRRSRARLPDRPARQPHSAPGRHRGHRGRARRRCSRSTA